MAGTVLILLAICFVAWFVIKGIGDHKSSICTRCEFIGGGKTKVRGNIAIEIVLWLCFIIPGLIYTLWRISAATAYAKSVEAPILCPLIRHLANELLTATENNKQRNLLTSYN